MDGPKIRLLREEMGMSQRAIAAAAFLSANHLSAVERGERRLSPERAKRLAIILGVPLADIRKEA